MSRLLSILFPGICHGSGFYLSFYVSPYSSGHYFSGVLLISLPVSFRVYYTYFISFTLLVVLWFSFTWSFCSSLFYLKTLVGMQFGRFLRTGLSSKSSVRSRVGTVSIELFARLATRSERVFPFGTTTAFGPYVNSFSEFTHYAFGGVCATSALRTLALHFGFGAEQACSAAARVTSSLPISGVSLRRQLVLRLASFMRRCSTPRFAACGPSSGVVRSPFFTAYMFLAALSYTRWVLLLGRRTCFPSAVKLAYCHRFQYVLSFPYSIRGVPAYRGGRMCFPTAVEYMAKFTFLYFVPFLSCILADRVLLLIDDPCARDFNFQVFKWRGQSLDWCRASCVVSPSS